MQWPWDGRIYKAFSGQWLGKHVPIARQLQQMDYNKGNVVFYVVRPEMLWAGQFGATSSFEDGGQPGMAWMRKLKNLPY
jgi:hypothetical protein